MRFKDTPAAKVLHGDCADLLRDRVPTLQERCTFYLDWNSIVNLPLLHELDTIATSPRCDHIVMIDDVRMFGTLAWDGLQRDCLAILMAINPKYAIRIRSEPEETLWWRHCSALLI